MRGLGFTHPAVQERARHILSQVSGDAAYLTLIADLSTLGKRCRFAVGERGALVARYLDLPFAALSFYGEGDDLRRTLAALLDPEEPCYTLVAAPQRTELAAVTRTLEVISEWQMTHRGDLADLDPEDAVALGSEDLTAMRALADRGEMHAFVEGALEGGPYYGLWRGGWLVAMAGTRLQVTGIAEIGNVVTDPEHRRQGLASAAVSATMVALYESVPTVLLHVVETNHAAVALYEHLGFERTRLMYLVRFAREGAVAAQDE